MTVEVPEFRRQVGFLLRLPIVAVLCLLWVFYVWWWIFGLSVVITVALLVLQPVLYLILWPLNWLALAFGNSGDPVLPGYWSKYPDSYLDWCQRCAKLGFPTLLRWLREGWKER